MYKGFIDDKLRPGLKPQVVAVKVLDLDGKQGHREWLVSKITILNLPNIIIESQYQVVNSFNLMNRRK